MLIVIGALDDKFDISFKIRLVVQTVLSIFMMHFADIRLENIESRMHSMVRAASNRIKKTTQTDRFEKTDC
ncbi:hypothetical protein [Vibrio chagasii]|uniref:hypothetical protein n=1 Tax=Vibrio chagasii TaxID=170679 RepID=UPI0022845886|nr:hypothetical protein [Vibrio chagasii]MCY9826475.1 hypothetical protein [Vibrio chagasii]